MESISRRKHRVAIEWDEDFELAVVMAECDCRHCKVLQQSIAEFLEDDEITIEGATA